MRQYAGFADLILYDFDLSGLTFHPRMHLPDRYGKGHI